MKPNFFEIATDEATQDGFITWLLQWANPIKWDNPNNDDINLNACAVAFVKFLIKTIFDKDLEITSVEADNNERDRTDIWAKINDEYLIIIEDKTFTGVHGNQLEEYKEAVKKWYPEKTLQTGYIYLKIGTESKYSIEKTNSIKNIEKEDFKYINRHDLVDFFKNHSDIKNVIYTDFIKKINDLDEEENAFYGAKNIQDVLKEKKEIDKMDSWNCQRMRSRWDGFYNYLASELENTSWGKISNDGKETKISTCCLLWLRDPLKWKGYYDVYLRIEQGPLYFKIKEKQKNIKEDLYKLLKKKIPVEIIKDFDNSGRSEIKRVAKIEFKDWANGDKEKVVNRLKEIRETMEKVLKDSQ